LESSQPEALANLQFVRDKSGAKTESRSWADRIFPQFRTDRFILIAFTAGWISCFCLAALLLKPRTERGSWRVPLVAALLVCGYAAAGAWRCERDSTLAIVIEKQAEARFAPADNSTLAASLPAGSRVWILRDRGPWVYCALPNNVRAWVSSKALEKVRLGSS
jgi:hypothetical protein